MVLGLVESQVPETALGALGQLDPLSPISYLPNLVASELAKLVAILREIPSAEVSLRRSGCGKCKSCPRLTPPLENDQRPR